MATTRVPPAAARAPARCHTRAMKNARFLRGAEPRTFGGAPSAKGFGTGLPLDVLARLHRLRSDAAELRGYPQVSDFLKFHKLPVPGRTARDPLFSGTVFFAQVTFQAAGGNLVVPNADMNTIVQYAKHAAVPIAQYATRFGTNSLAVADNPILYTVNVPSGTFSDADLQGWVNDMAGRNGLPQNACIFVVCPQGISAPNVGGNAGYHGLANIPYIVAGVYAQNLSLQDAPDVYAMVVSHEIAEMMVDPRVDGQNPEVCDPCDVNCSNLTRVYFDGSDRYLGANQSSPPGGFAFTYYICAVVNPAGASSCPAPSADCEYAPVIEGQWFELYSEADSLATLNVASNADGRLEVFGVNAAGRIWHTWQTAPSNGWTGGWEELYSDADSLVSLRAARNQDGRLEVFGVNAAGRIWHTWQTTPNGGWVGNWAELYSDVDNLAMLDVAQNADGRLELFGVNAAGHIWHTWQTAPSNGWNGGWDELYRDSDTLKTLRVARNLDGRLEVFGINGAGRIFHTWQTAPNDGWVGEWAELYTDSDNLATLDVAQNADGRLEVFGVNAAGRIWHTWQIAPSGGWNGGWEELYSDADSLAMLRIGRNLDGRLELFGVNEAGHIWHTWQTAPNDGWVGEWAELYTDSDNLAMLDVVRNADGRLEVFGVNAAGRIWHTWQTAPNNGWV